MRWSPESVKSARSSAGAALQAWADLVSAVEQATPEATMESARSAVAAVLTPAGATPGSDGPAQRFAEQMTADVASLTEEQRREGLQGLGRSALQFVQAVWVCDMSARAGRAFSQIFGEPILDQPAGAGSRRTSRDEPWPAQERFLRKVAMLTSLDPVTSEMIRLRGARAHRCRLCQSLRSRTAVRAAGGESAFDSVDAYESGGIPERQKVALRLVDAFIWQPMTWPASLALQLGDHYEPPELAEMIFDIVRNSSNKIAVAFAADAPHVEDGIEYYDIDYSNGELVYGLAAD